MSQDQANFRIEKSGRKRRYDVEIEILQAGIDNLSKSDQ